VLICNSLKRILLQVKKGFKSSDFGKMYGKPIQLKASPDLGLVATNLGTSQYIRTKKTYQSARLSKNISIKSKTFGTI
jgi:hypothetical protein